MDEMDSMYEFRVRPFCAFDETSDDGDSTYFDIDHETGQRVSRLYNSTPYRGNSPPFEIQNLNFSTCDQKENVNDDEKNVEATPGSLKKRKSSSVRKSCPVRLFELRSTPSRLSRLSSATSEAEISRLSALMSSGQILRSGTVKAGLPKEELLNISKKNKYQSPLRMQELSTMSFTPEKRDLNDENEESNIVSVNQSNIVEKPKRHVRFAKSASSTPELRSPLVDRKQLTPYRLPNRGVHHYTPSCLKTKGSFGNMQESCQQKVPLTSNSTVTPHAINKTSTARLFNSERKIAAKIPHSKFFTPKLQRVNKFTPSGKTKIDQGCSSNMKHFTVHRAGASSTDCKKVPGRNAKTTIVKPFTFQTDKRINSVDQNSAQQKGVNFVSNLRHNSPKNAAALRCTKPKPFSFDQPSNKRKRDSQEKTLAEKVNCFHNKTPERFRSKAAGTAFQPQAMTNHQLVRPLSPKLQAQMRQRPNPAISQKQREEMELQEIKSYKFEAQPFNKRLLHSPHLPKPTVKPSTIPTSVHLATEKRTEGRKNPMEEEKFVFHAKEAPKKILQGPVGMKAKKVIPSTQPKSPAFALKKRCEEWRNSATSVNPEACSSTFKAHPVPRLTSPFVVKHEKKFIETKPFSFDGYDKERYALKDKKIQEEIENDKKLAEFHARPLPLSASKAGNNGPVKIPSTKPVPFNFESGNKIPRKVTHVEIKENVKKFKAQPAAVVKKKPFVPKKTIRPATVVTGFQLSTDERATKRRKLRELQANAVAEKECLLQQQLQEKEEEKKEEMKQFRQALVHKANPVKCYRPVLVKPSQKTLTRPQSPNFATDTRVALRRETFSP